MKRTGMGTGSILVLAVLLAGCSQRPVSPSFRGVYTEGFEVSGFIPCGGGRDAWLYADGDQLQAADQRIAQLRNSANLAYPRIYVEFDGMDEGKGQEGFPADYDRVIRVIRLRSISPTVPADCTIPDM